MLVIKRAKAKLQILFLDMTFCYMFRKPEILKLDLFRSQYRC